MDTEQLATVLGGYPYPLVFASVTGSHAFGCATDLSDYDVHGVHLLHLESILGLRDVEETVEIKPKGVLVDIATHDLKKFIFLLLKGNGNVLEDLYSPLVICSSPVHEELRVLGKGCISKMCAAHYKGMAFNQQRRMQFNDVKKLLHCYRCLLMGMHLMRSGELVMDLASLAREYYHPQVLEVIEAKRGGVEGLDSKEMKDHIEIIGRLYQQLDTAAAESQLPDRTPPAVRDAMEQLLIEVRLKCR